MLYLKYSIIVFAVIGLYLADLQPSSCADDTNNDTSIAIGPIGEGKSVHRRNAKTTHIAISARLFKPVVHLQEEVVRLEEQIANLTIPLKELQTGTQTLMKQVSGIEGLMPELLDQLRGTQSVTTSLHTELNTLGKTTAELRGPVIQLRDPILKIQKPLMSVDTNVASLGSRFSRLDMRFAELDQRFADLGVHFSELGSRFTELDNRFKELDGRFKELDGRFSVLDGRFVTLGRQLASLRAALSWVVASVVAGAAIIAAGTIFAAIVIVQTRSRPR